MLLPSPLDADREAIRFGADALTHAELADVATAVALRLDGLSRVAVWATPTIQTCVAVVGALTAGAAVVPLNPKIGERELAHILADCEPSIVLTSAGVTLPDALAALPRLDIDITELSSAPPIIESADDKRAPTIASFDDKPAPTIEPVDGKPARTIELADDKRAPIIEPADDMPALIVYTSGTTGPPKGVLLPRRSISSNLDALATAWEWTAEDVLVHALPLFHVHGLILGILGPLRRGGTVRHLGRFDSHAIGAEFEAGATMMFGVPTMYHRLAADCEADPALAARIGQARLLVSGSAALPASDHARITATTGQRVLERYGMTETLMNCTVRATGDRRPGAVGPPVDGVDLRLVDDAGAPIVAWDSETVGEIEVRGPNLFLGYLNRPDATEAALRDGWFRTGDMAVRDADGYVRIVGRRATDLIKSGGYKIGAGEIENALLEHPGVAEAAVTGEPDEDLGERIVAWIVPVGEPPTLADLADHVARLLSPHKRPRVVRYLDSLPRNEMGKITKRALHV